VYSARTVAVAFTGLALCFGSLQASATPAAAAPTCSAPGLKKGQTPVILAHGLGSSAATWTGNNGASMVSKLKSVKGLYIETFDYSLKNKNLTWVTDPQIAPRFAERVNCLNKLAGEKVVAGGHSMGGLLIREAAATVGSKIGFIFTLGTPNSGSGWANVGTNLLRAICPLGVVNDNSICDVDAMRGLRTDSDEINRLPKHNGSIPLLAVAGDVTMELELGFATVHKDTDSDLVVSKQSALQFDSHQEQGGDQKNIPCSGPGPWDIACHHTRLPHNSEATRAVADAVKKYLSHRDEQRRLAEQAKNLEFHGLTIPLLSNWTEGRLWQHANPADTTGIKTGGCPRDKYGLVWCSGAHVFGPEGGKVGHPTTAYSPQGAWDPFTGVQQCPMYTDLTRAGYSDPLGYPLLREGTAKIGNRSVLYHEWKIGCAAADGSDGGNPAKHFVQKVWYDPQSKIFIVDEWNTPGLREALANATWN
jgi:hypothetical protein